MKLEINKIVTLGNNEEYLIVDKVEKDGKEYYYVAQVNEDETDIEVKLIKRRQLPQEVMLLQIWENATPMVMTLKILRKIKHMAEQQAKLLKQLMLCYLQKAKS